MSDFKNDSDFAGFVEGHSSLATDRPLSAVAQFLTKSEMVSVDPIHDAMVKAMSDSIQALGEIAEKEGVDNLHEAMSYHREAYEFDSREFENEVLPPLASSLIHADALSKIPKEQLQEEGTDMLKLAKTLNTIADVSDAIVNLAINSSVADVLLDDPSEEELGEYFSSMHINKSFVETFLRPFGVSVTLEPLFEIDTLDPVWKMVRVPYMTIEHEGSSIKVMVVPCATYSPNWFVAVNKFRVLALSYMDEANLHIENIATKGYSNVFHEDPEVGEEE